MKSKSLLVAFLFSAGLSANTSNSRADVFEIRGGGTITGKLLNEPSSTILKIRTNDGVELEIASSKLKPPVLVPAETEKAYAASLAGKEDTAALHRAVSQECAARNQTALSYAHKERVVELDPSDENWVALAEHIKDKLTGEWVRRDVAFRRKGMANLGLNKWDTPQSKALSDSDTKQLADAGKVRSLIELNLKNLNDRSPKGVKAVEFFNDLSNASVFYEKYKLDHKLAIKRISELIPKEVNPSRVEMFMAILAQMPGNSASPVFVDIAMNSPNSELVNQALELLARSEWSREYAFNQFLGVIRNPKSKPPAIDRAGSNLQAFSDNRSIPSLIERLITIVKTTITIPGTNSFSKDGSGGLSQSTGGTKTQESIYNHQPVLTALVGLADGANYQYNIPEWRTWYANTYAKTNLDLRRDE